MKKQTLIALLAASLAGAMLPAASSLAAGKPKAKASPKPKASPKGKASPSPMATGSTIEPVTSAPPSPSPSPTPATVTVTSNDPVAIVGATVWTMDGAPIENGTVLFRDGKIVEIGKNIEIPGKAKRIDGTGKIVTPGLVDSSTFLGTTEIDQARTTWDFSMADGAAIHSAFRVSDGLNPESALIPVARMEGVTSVVSRPEGGLISGQGAWIRLDGRRVEDLVVLDPVAMFSVLGEGGKAAAGNSRAGALRRLREAFDDARFLRTHETALDENRVRSLSAARLDLESLWPVIDRKIPLVIRAQRASDIEIALKFARDEKIRIIIEGAAEGWKVAEDLAAAKVPVILQAMTDLPGSFETLGSRFDNAAKLDAAGVAFSFTANSTSNIRTIRQEAGLAAAWGLAKDKALAAITRVPAEMFGVAARTGTLARGKSADIVLWSGDPLELSTQPLGVWIEGREIPMHSRQTELLDRYRTLPPTR